MKKTEKPWGKTHLLEIINVSSCSDDFECIPSKVETTSSVLRQWAIKTQPLSNCVLRACAYQRARQRKMGIAKKNLAKALDDYLAQEGCLEHPFSKQILRNYQPCVSTPKTPEHHKERVNQKKHCQSQLMPTIFILQLRRNIPWTTMTSIELRLLNTCCITQKVRCWGGNNQKDTAKEQGHGRKTYKVFSLNPFY